MDEKLLSGIKINLALGTPKSVVENIFLKGGYTKEDISQAFVLAQASPELSPDEQKTLEKSKRFAGQFYPLYLSLCGLVLGVISLIFFMYPFSGISFLTGIYGLYTAFRGRYEFKTFVVSILAILIGAAGIAFHIYSLTSANK